MEVASRGGTYDGPSVGSTAARSGPGHAAPFPQIGARSDGCISVLEGARATAPQEQFAICAGNSEFGATLCATRAESPDVEGREEAEERGRE